MPSNKRNTNFYPLPSSRPIGLFDSGVGGLSVMSEVIKLLPRESIIYFADSAHCPYGQKSPTQIKKLSARVLNFLLQKNCKLIIVACNTVSVNALPYLRSLTNIPLVGIEPATKVAAGKTKSGAIGILATKGTFQGQLFQTTKNKFAQNIAVHIEPGHGLVEQVEAGELSSAKTKKLLKKNLHPLLKNKIDQLVLGCTHYPFLVPLIKKIVGHKIGLINPAPAVARQTKIVLRACHLLNPTAKSPAYTFYTTSRKFPLRKFLPGLKKNYPLVKIKL